jgi:hypothetical protein
MKSGIILLLTAFTLCASGVLQIFGHHWTVYDPADWSIGQDGGTPVLHLVKPRDPLPGPRRPIQFAIAETAAYGDVTVEADVRPLQRSLMIVFSYRDPAHFDYAHLSFDTGMKQPVHNGIFHVYGGERVRISSPEGPSAFTRPGQWYHVKLIHEAKSGSVSVSVDGRAVPALHAVDVSLPSGKIGLGSFDETADFKNVTISSRSPN